MSAILWGGIGGVAAFVLLAAGTIIAVLWASNRLFGED